jgi:hypothetical protein
MSVFERIALLLRFMSCITKRGGCWYNSHVIWMNSTNCLTLIYTLVWLESLYIKVLE